MNGFMLTAAGTPIFTILYMAVIVGFFYFFLIRPQRKEQKEKQAMLSSLAIGDSVLTTAGFYGVVIDMTEDTVIVEFGNNKNCRIIIDVKSEGMCPAHAFYLVYPKRSI